jgi:hypothetical protein
MGSIQSNRTGRRFNLRKEKEHKLYFEATVA